MQLDRQALQFATTAGTGAGAAERASRARVGQRFGRYELRALIGIGGMGAVYAAYDHELDRAVALKVLRAEGDAPELADRLIRESRMMAKIAHPSVIAVYDVGRAGDAVFIAMELIRGTTLTAWLASQSLDWRAIVGLFERAGQGLAAAHGAGIVHRDFKPDNVLVAREARKVIVTDFGIAREAVRSLAGEPSGVAAPVVGDTPPATGALGALGLTTDGAAIGTPPYMAPEQFRGETVDRRADIFAFSVSLWEALFGVRPFEGRSMPEIIAAQLEPPVRPAGVRLPRRLVRALEKGLAFDRHERWQSMPELLAELAAIVCRPRRLVFAAAAAGLVGVGVAAALAVHRPAPPVDRCAQALAQLGDAYNPALEASLATVLAGQRALEDSTLDKLRATADRWRATHAATCHADREQIQDPKTTACLDARRLELAAAVNGMIASGPARASLAPRMTNLIGDPSACAEAASAPLFVHVPADPALQAKVTQLRYRLGGARSLYNLGDLAGSLREAEAVAAEASSLWPPLHAEALFGIGAIQGKIGDDKRGVATLLDGAALATRVHYDDLATKIWEELAHHSFNHGDVSHAVDYVTSSEAAWIRAGRPAKLAVGVMYERALMLLATDRLGEGEQVLHNAIEMSDRSDPGADASIGAVLGMFYRSRGRYADAVAALRRATAHEAPSTTGPVSHAWNYADLATDLVELGQRADAQAAMHQAIERADRELPDTELVRWTLHVDMAMVKQDLGYDDEALAELDAATARIAALFGTRGARYGEALESYGELDSRIGHHRDAEAKLARGCDIIAFNSGEGTSDVAWCETSHAVALLDLHRDAAALAKVSAAVPALIKSFGEATPKIAHALTVRGAAHAALGHRREAIADFDQAIAILAHIELDTGYLASAKWRRARELWPEPRPEQQSLARAEISAALDLFDRANHRWDSERAKATAWLASHERIARR